MIERSFLRAILTNRAKYHYKLWHEEKPPYAEENPLDERKMHERNVMNCMGACTAVFSPPIKGVVQSVVQEPQHIEISTNTH